MVSRKGFIPATLIAVLALVIVVGGVGIGLAWRTNYLDKWLPPNIKEMFGRGEKPEEEPETEPEEDLTKDWKTYTNTKHNYQLKVPKDFELQELSADMVVWQPLGWIDSSAHDRIGFRRKESYEGWYHDPQMVIYHEPDERLQPPPGMGIVQWLRTFYKGSDFYEENIPGEPNFEVGGVPAVKIIVPYRSGAGSIRDEIHFIKDGKWFIIDVYVDPGTGEPPDEAVATEFKGLCYLMLSTFKFIK